MSPPQSERSVELRIESLAAGGDGVGRAPDGRVVFVPFAAPGDRVRALLVEEKARYARARLESVLEVGPARCAPVCPVFGTCGGCAWQHVRYEAQVRAKHAILRDALARVGHLTSPPIEFVPSPVAYGTRGRARLRVEAGRVGFRQRRSHTVCAVKTCPVLAAPLEQALTELAAHPPSEAGEWELTLGAHDQVRSCRLGQGAQRPIALVVAGERLEVSPGVFLQGNAALLEPLAGALTQAAGKGERGLELFAGAGFFTLGLARRFTRLLAVESSRAAVRDLRRNLHAAGRANVRVVRSRAESALRSPEVQQLRPEVVVLDPPREGLGRESTASLARLAPRRVVYLSCDPATLARDLAVLVAAGYVLRAVTGFDLFPQTPHVEGLAVVDRS